MKIIGIDNGLDGGLSTRKSDGSLNLYVMPRILSEIDVTGFCEIVEQEKPDLVFVERGRAVSGPSSKSATFTFGYVCGQVDGVLRSTGIKTVYVQPKEWQKSLWQGTPSKLTSKQKSMVTASRLFPKEKFLTSSRSTKPHDGLIDAALIMFYGEMFYDKR